MGTAATVVGVASRRRNLGSRVLDLNEFQILFCITFQKRVKKFVNFVFKLGELGLC